MNTIKPRCNKKPFAILSVWLVFISMATYSQTSVQLLDKNGQPAAIEKHARFLTAESRSGDNAWKYEMYHFLGPLITVGHYKDKKHTIPHGQLIYYSDKGRVDSIHRYNNGIPHGSWYYLNDTGRFCIQKEFENGILVKTTDYLLQDSLDKANGIIKSGSLQPGEKESEFTGGASGWRKFLNQNFRYPGVAIDNEIMGTVMLFFAVNEAGKIEDPIVLKSVEYSLDHETLRIMSISPDWVPGEKDWKKVTTFKKQPITYKLETSGGERRRKRRA